MGSGAGIDIFLAAKKVLDSGKAIGIDMTDQMLKKARENATKGNYSNVEFKKGDIEENIPLNSNSVDAVISNCVINLTTNKINAFKEVFRILRSNGRMVISDLITDVELPPGEINSDQWCECIAPRAMHSTPCHNMLPIICVVGWSRAVTPYNC